MGVLINNDATLFRNYFKEMARLIGITVKYQYPIDMKFSDYGEENPKGFSEPRDVDIIFDENPQIKTLRKYGWITEGDEAQPYIVHFPYDTKNLEKGCRITIQSNLRDKGRLFVVTDIKTSLEFPEAWICKVAPVFHNKKVEKDVKISTYKSNNSFINVK